MAGRRLIGLVVGLLLLVPIARTLVAPAPGWTGRDSGAAPAGSRDVVRMRIDGVLARTNPRLDSATRERIARVILRCESEQELDPDLVLAVMLVESSGRPAARSPKGAIGLMQVMPHMFEELGLPGNVAHIEANVEAGCLLLADNIRRLGEEQGISAYFWGDSVRGHEYLQRVRSVRAALARVPDRGPSRDG
jgi:soluble lytic murein transglycosylase-like protein